MFKLSLCLFAILFSVLNTACADESHPGIVTTLVIRSSDDWSGVQLPPYLKDIPEIALMRYTIPPQAALPIHQHPAINAAYVMDGEVTVFKEGGTIRGLDPETKKVTWTLTKDDFGTITSKDILKDGDILFFDEVLILLFLRLVYLKIIRVQLLFLSLLPFLLELLWLF